MKKEKSQLKIGIILNYLNMGIGTLIPIFYTPVMLQLLGQDEYGLYKLACSVTSYLGLISMGLGSAVSRYLIKAQTEGGKESEENVLGLFLRIFRVIAISCFVIGLILVNSLHIWYTDSLSPEGLQKMKILVFILVCNTSISFSVSPYMSVVSAHERFLFLQIMNIFTTVLMPIVNLIVLFFGAASIGMAMSSLFMTVLGRTIYLIYIRHYLNIKPKYSNLPKHLIKEIFIFSFWVFVANIVHQLYNATDTVMIGSVPALGTKSVAIYNVGTTFSGLTTTMTIGVSTLLSPRANKMVFAGASNRELTDLAIRVGRIQGYIVTLIVSGFIAFGRPFLHYYAGDKYADSYWIAIVLMLPNLIPLVQSVCLSILVAKNKHKFRSLTYLGIAIVNVIGTWILMHTRLGVVGAALMTGIATFLGQGIVMNWYYSKKINLEMGSFWKSLMQLYIVPVILCSITIYASKYINLYSLPILFGGIILYTVVFCVLTWFLIANSYEKNLILSPLGRLFKGRR